MLSNYLTLDAMHLVDTQWAVILPAAFSTFPVFIMYHFFRSIPKGIIESAELDGANKFQVFLSIGVPLGFIRHCLSAGLKFSGCVESDRAAADIF